MYNEKEFIITEKLLSTIINYFATELVWKDADPYIQALRQLKVLNEDSDTPKHQKVSK